VYQYLGETSKYLYSRFEYKYSEINNLGELLNDGELGTKVFEGLLTLNTQILRSFIASQNIICNLENMETMCNYLDRLNDDPLADRQSI